MMATTSDENSTWPVYPWYPRPSIPRVVHIYNENPWYKPMINKKRKKWK